MKTIWLVYMMFKSVQVTWCPIIDTANKNFCEIVVVSGTL